MITITVKQQKEIDNLAMKIKNKKNEFIAVEINYNYHKTAKKVKLRFLFYNEITGFVCFNTPEELINYLKEEEARCL